MAMQTDHDDDVLADINIVPFVDIVLVLLIIFMVTARFIVTPAIKVDLPKALSEDKLDLDRATLSILMGPRGDIVLSGVTEQVFGEESMAVTPAELDEKLAKISRDVPKVQVTIQADRALAHGRVIGMIDRVKHAGISTFAFNVDPRAADMLAEPVTAPAP